MTHRPVISLTDCVDPDALARQSARIAALFGSTPSILPLTGDDPEGAAALTLLSTLRATELTGAPTHPTVILVNIAPRDGHWPNGVPFCWFQHGGHLVVSTWNPRVLSLLATHLGLEKVQVTDVREVLEAAAGQWADLSPEQVDEIARTQFRSLWYVPLLARWLVDGHPVPAQPQAVAPAETAETAETATTATTATTAATAATAESATTAPGPRIAVVDNFGNCKLDHLADAVPGHASGAVQVHSRREGRLVEVPCYDRLPDVPQGQPGVTTGSSGFGFAELVVRGGSAAELFGLAQGDYLQRLTS